MAALRKADVSEQAFCRKAQIQAVGVLPQTRFARALDWIHSQTAQ